MYDSVKYLCMGLRSCAHFDVVYSCWKYKQQPSRELARRKERGKRKSFVHNDDAGELFPHQTKLKTPIKNYLSLLSVNFLLFDFALATK